MNMYAVQLSKPPTASSPPPLPARKRLFVLLLFRESPINDILDKDSFTLEEILAQDEVLQEAKSLNIKLVEL